jgi:hypothetical protein
MKFFKTAIKLFKTKLKTKQLMITNKSTKKRQNESFFQKIYDKSKEKYVSL